MDSKGQRGRLRPPSLLSLNIPRPTGIPELGRDWFSGSAERPSTSRKRSRPADETGAPAKKKKRRRKTKRRKRCRPRSKSGQRVPSPKPPPHAEEDWQAAEDVEPEAPLERASKPLVPYTPSPTPSPQTSREPSPVRSPEREAEPMEMSPEPSEELLHQVPAFEPSRCVKLERAETRVFRKSVVEAYWNVRLDKEALTGAAAAVMEKVLACLQYVVQKLLAGEDPDTTAQLYVTQNKMYNGHRASEMALVKDLDLQAIMKKLEEVANSLKPAAAADDDGDTTADELNETFWDTCTFVLVTRKKKMSVGMPLGTSLYKRSDPSVDTYAKTVRSLQDPSLKAYRMKKSLRDSCLLNCTALGLHKIRNPTHKANDVLKYIHGSAMEEDVKELARLAGVPFKGPHDVAVLARIQQSLGVEHQINVYTAPAKPVHSFGPNSAPNHINIFLQAGEEGQPAHARLITKMAAFFGAEAFCELCKKTTRKTRKSSTSAPAKHKCKLALCKMCMQAECTSTAGDPKIRKTCDICSATFKTQACFDGHLKLCGKSKRCLVCWELCRMDEFPDHPCGMPFCKSFCIRRHSPFEPCYVPTENPLGDSDKEAMWEASDPPEGQLYRPAQQAASPEEAEEEPSLGPSAPAESAGAEERAAESRVGRPKKKPRRRAYADAETSCDPVTGALTVSLIVVKIIRPGEEPQRHVFSGPRAGHDLVAAFIAKGSPFKHTTVVWHNAAKFDAHILWRAALDMQLKPDMTRKGGMIIKMAFKPADVVIMDSLLFLPNTPLSKFPEIFGLETGAKGHYPFKLTGTKLVDDDGYYLGEGGSRFPDFKDFLPDGVRPKAYKELRAWWEAEAAKFTENPLLRYHLQREELRYCEQDVDILMGGFEIFRESWMRRYPDMDVFDSMTLPQFINRFYRRHFMKPKSITPLPPQGYQRDNNRGSVEAFCWMQLERRRLREAGTPLSQLRDCRRSGEVRISGAKVDGTGVDSSGRRHVFQFHGCWWHGCPDCAAKKEKPLSERQKEAYIVTQETSARLRALSSNPESPYGLFEYHEIWEHSFLDMVKAGPNKAYWAKFKKSWPSDQLKLRAAFHGGRTNAVMHRINKVPKGWTLHYVDFTSLYPSINYGAKGELYPEGPPQIFIGPDMGEEPGVPQLADAFGFWKVKVHPPRQLYIPVLPMTVNGKLVFPLCRTCAEEERQGLCSHSQEERVLSGTYFTEELRKAVEMGYQLETPEEIWEWPKEQRTGKMFKKFIRELYAQKVLSSAKPKSPEEMAEVLEDVRTSVGLRLHPDDFKENACQRAQAKFALNNIWGFHGKTGRPSQTEIVATEEELEALECQPDTEITAMRILHGEQQLMVEFKRKVEQTWRTGSMAVAAMTTGWARLRLYELLQKYQQHVVYFDTDSAFLLLPPGVEPPLTSSKLGDLKNEVLETYGPGKSIAAFVSLGPKSYAYLIVDEEGRPFKLEFKLKGVSLTKAALEGISFELMEQLAGDRTKEVRLQQWNITRNLLKASLCSHSFTKRLAFSSTKRFFIPEGPGGFKKTLPYGYAYDDESPAEQATHMALFTPPPDL